MAQIGTLMGAGDVISQLTIEQKTVKEFEISRTIRFFGLGTLFVGPTLKTWYGILNTKLGSTGGRTAFKKMIVDQGFFAPIFISLFISVLGITQGKKSTEIEKQLKSDYVDIVLANWTVWPAVQMCNFNYVPVQHQVLVAQTFALLWNIYLAWKTNSNSKDVELLKS
ncbi:unnamed protein product, partial [Meganyctiphanes norvegica]